MGVIDLRMNPTIALFTCVALLVGSPSAVAAERPNIVVILTDDQANELQALHDAWLEEMVKSASAGGKPNSDRERLREKRRAEREAAKKKSEKRGRE